MTEKQAYKILMNTPIIVRKNPKEYSKALHIAMSALNKQIAKKTNETDAYPHRLYCPKCYYTFCFNKENLDAIKQLQMYNYCPDCGQALLWGGDY